MDIGKPERVINVEPLELPADAPEPVEAPAVTPPARPVEEPAVATARPAW